MTYAERTAHLRPEGAYQVLAKAQQLEAEGRQIIHLEIGQPDVDTFAHIVQSGVAAISAGKTRYTPPAGMPALRRVIAAEQMERRGFHVSPEEVVIGPGAKPLLFFPALALINPGDEVIYPDPGFPTYEAMITLAGGIPVPVPLLEENQFSFDLERFQSLAGPRTKLIILNSPSNPTGGVIPAQDLEVIAETALKYGAWVLSDEIYARVIYDGLQAPSIAALPGMKERTVIVDGFSKTYAMTGWRLGYGIMPAGLAGKIDLLLTHSVGCTAQFTQVAGVEAVSGPQDCVDEVVREYQARRDLVVDGLNAIPGVSCQRPQGAFYAFPNVKSFGKTSSQLADYLLETAGVALLPGSSFGKSGEGYLRISYATSREILKAGLERMAEALAKLS